MNRRGEVKEKERKEGRVEHQRRKIKGSAKNRSPNERPGSLYRE